MIDAILLSPLTSNSLLYATLAMLVGAVVLVLWLVLRAWEDDQ